jgi:TPR repeat protein
MVSALLFGSVAQTSGQQAATQSAAPETSSAAGKPVIYKINVATDERGLSIEILANSAIVPDTERLEHPDRLVFDFAGFSLQGPPQHIPVNKGPVSAVRASLFQASPPLTRIVIDLKEPTSVELQPFENRVVIRVPFESQGPRLKQSESKNAPPSESPPAVSRPIGPSKSPPASSRPIGPSPSIPQAVPDGRTRQRSAREYDVLERARAVTLEELPSLESKAEGGDPEAETLLALAYHAGVLLKNDEAEALRLLHRAAARGYVPAQESLGIYYTAGIGMEKPDPQAALQWYTAAAEKGSVDAATNIGSMYAIGDGIPKDMSAAIRWFRRASDAGGGSAEYNLSVIYRRGDGVPQDEQQALSWLTKAANHDFIPALREMGFRAAYPRDGSAADIPMALQRYKRAAELGDAISQAILGDIFANGEMVQPDYEQAAKYYRMAADQGQKDGEFGLAARYTLGQGVPVDQGEAMRLFKAAADQGHADAQYDLGVMYELGQAAEPDLPSAAHYYQLAAEGGVVKAQYRIGVLLSKGLGVQTDRVSAYKWLMLSQDSVPSAAKALNDLRPSMSAGEISEAERQVDAWRVARKQPHH